MVIATPLPHGASVHRLSHSANTRTEHYHARTRVKPAEQVTKRAKHSQVLAGQCPPPQTKKKNRARTRVEAAEQVPDLQQRVGRGLQQGGRAQRRHLDGCRGRGGVGAKGRWQVLKWLLLGWHVAKLCSLRRDMAEGAPWQLNGLHRQQEPPAQQPAAFAQRPPSHVQLLHWCTQRTCKALALSAVCRLNGLEEDGHAGVAHALALVLVCPHNHCRTAERWGTTSVHVQMAAAMAFFDPARAGSTVLHCSCC